MKNNFSTIRFHALIIFFILLFGAVFWRLYWLQIVKHRHYTALAEKQYKQSRELLPQRGDILLRGGSEDYFAAAINKEMPTVFVVPAEIKDKERVVKLLSETLQISEEKIRKKVFKENDPYEVIKRKLTVEEADRIRQAQIAGIHFENEKWRYYPGNELAAQSIGFLGYQDDRLVGRYGIEQEFDKVLRGQKGFLRESGDVAGRWIAFGQRQFQPPKHGSDVYLTLDRVIQFNVELALRNAVEKHQADGGKIIVVDVPTGKILAMASWPTFNPNNYSQYSIAEFRNPIINDTYEPGSVMKAITMASALDAGRVSPGTTYYDTGAVPANGFVIKNSDNKAYGRQTMTQVIEKSLNTGAIFVEKTLGHHLFRDYLYRFGFGHPTGIKLPGEVAGNLRNLNDYQRDVNFYTASFGQGIAVTPLQLVMAYATMANKGVLMKPQIVEKIVSPTGQIKVFAPEAQRQVISSKSAQEISLMLESNVKNGHGKLAAVPGYRVAGKTGTAQIPDKEKGGYLEGATIGTFAGFAPVDNPRFALVVIIDHPRDTEWAAGTAAPVFGELTRFLLEYFSISPTEEFTEDDLVKFDQKHQYLTPSIKSEDGENHKINEKDLKKD